MVTGQPPVQLTPQTSPAAGSLGQVTWDSPQGEPQSLDPVADWNIQENTTLSNVCESLFRLNANLQVEPALATSMRQTAPGNYLISLRHGVRFSDGTPMTSADVVYSIERHMKSPADAWGEYSSQIGSIRAVSPSAVQLDWKPSANFSLQYTESLLYSALGTVVEQRYAQAEGSKFGTAGGGLMCTGPFKLANWTPGQQITLTPNPYYWDAALKPHTKSFVLKFITDPGTITSGLQTGELDGSFDLPFSSLPQLTSSPTGKVYYGNNWEQFGILDATTKGLATDSRIRKALSLAIDRAGLAATAFDGKATPAKWIFPPSSYGYSQSAFAKAYAQLPDNSHPQIAQAKQLIAQAGLHGQTMTVAAEAGNPESVDVATAMQAAAQQIGLNMKIRVLTPAAFDNAVFTPSGRAGLDWLVGVGGTLFATFPVPADLLFDLALKTSTSNYAGIVDPQITRDTLGALTTSNTTKAAQLAVSGAKLYTNENAFIPVVNVPSLVYMNKRITGPPTSFPSYMFYPWAAEVGAS
jgi:peptide/nickel transport system substrate-binding protein